jgi:hypothetical protein
MLPMLFWLLLSRLLELSMYLTVLWIRFIGAPFDYSYVAVARDAGLSGKRAFNERKLIIIFCFSS